MFDRCGRCGWPLQGYFACCPGAGYWSRRAPLPRDVERYGELITVDGWYFYDGLRGESPLFQWSPVSPKEPGYHHGYPPLVHDVYLAHLDKEARRPGGARSLLHYKDFLATIDWCAREIARRASLRPLSQPIAPYPKGAK